MYDFITIGGTTRDISFFTDQGVLLNNKKDILRQKLLAFESGAKIKVDKFYYSYGGGSANAAVCLTNFGFKTACIAPVGSDANGNFIIKNLKDRKVDTSLMQKIKNEESGSSFVLIAPSGERIIFAQRGANTALNISQKDLSVLKKTRNIYISSLAGNWEKNLNKIFSVVTSAGPSVFWNPGMTQFLGGIDKISKYLKKTTVLASNKDEMTQLVISSHGYQHLKRAFLNRPENLLKIVYGLGPKIVIITLGDKGVIAYDGKKIYRRPIFEEVKRLDTTGVGDIFNSTFAAGLNLYLGDIDKSLQLSLENAAAKVTHLGAQNGLLKIKN